MDRVRVGRLGARTSGSLLPAHSGGAETAGARARPVDAVLGRRWPGDAARMMRRWLERIRAVFRRRRLEGELSEELAFHLEMQARKHRDAGMSAADAAALARRQFGNVELVKEDARDVRGVRPLEDVLQDVR